LGAPHYRSDVDWTEDGLADADAAYARIENFLDRAAETLGEVETAPVPQRFAAAMDDDLAVPRALGVLHETVREGNAALAAGEKEAASTAYAATRAMVDALGLTPGDFSTGADDGRWRHVADALVPAMLAARQSARERKDFAEADRIRDALAHAGVVVEDTPAGQRWRLG